MLLIDFTCEALVRAVHKFCHLNEEIVVLGPRTSLKTHTPPFNCGPQKSVFASTIGVYEKI